MNIIINDFAFRRLMAEEISCQFLWIWKLILIFHVLCFGQVEQPFVHVWSNNWSLFAHPHHSEWHSVLGGRCALHRGNHVSILGNGNNLRLIIILPLPNAFVIIRFSLKCVTMDCPSLPRFPRLTSRAYSKYEPIVFHSKEDNDHDKHS